MPKMKTRKAVKKRFKLTAGGRVKRKQAYRSHLLGKKSSKRKRNLRHTTLVSKTQESQIRSMIQG